MAKTLRGLKSEGSAPPTTCALILFSVGGRRLAAKVEEVGGVWPWTDAMPVPSDTPHVNALVRRGEEVLPVYDLAARFHVRVTGKTPFCLVVKHRKGPLALCIDAALPTLHTVEVTGIRAAASPEPDCLGSCLIAGHEVALYSLKTLGEAADAAR